MNQQKTSEFLSKIIEAKKLEGEALSMLLPDHINDHLDVIKKEVKAMVIEIAMEACTKSSGKAKDKDDHETNKRVKKVEII